MEIFCSKQLSLLSLFHFSAFTTCFHVCVFLFTTYCIHARLQHIQISSLSMPDETPMDNVRQPIGGRPWTTTDLVPLLSDTCRKSVALLIASWRVLLPCAFHQTRLKPHQTPHCTAEPPLRYCCGASTPLTFQELLNIINME